MISIPHSPINFQRYNEVIEVTPEMAFKWLEGNTHNRPVIQAHVERLAREIRAGRWHPTHQGIAFDTNGLLIDGQHRLWAIVEAKIPVSIRVFYNEPPENVIVLDCGQRRSNLDVLNIVGEVGKITNKHLATLRAMLAGRYSAPQRMTPSEEGELYQKYREAIDFSVEHFASSSYKGITTATVRSVIARAYYSCDHGKLARFCEILRTGLASEEADSPVTLLFQYLIRTNESGNGEGVRRMRYSKVEWGLDAFMKGKNPQRLGGSDHEIFPLPDEILNEAAA
jgi:hypothetical protein